MALIFPAPITPARSNSIRDFLQSIASSDGLAILREAQAAQLVVSDGLSVYTVALADIIAGNLLTQAKQHLWRHLLILNQEALAEIDLAGSAEAAEVVALHMGLRAGPTLSGIAHAEALPQTSNQNFEVRFLQCASIHFMALWLHGTDSQEDWVLPVEPDRTGLSLYQAVQETELLQVLQPLAQGIAQVMARPGSEELGN